MFTRSADLYDKFYSWKNYRAEADAVQQILRDRVRSGGRELLDIACGTGAHLVHLGDHWAITGTDLGEDVLAVARQRLPDCEFIQADMAALDLGRRFDVITCLFSSIGYLVTGERLAMTCQAMARHLKPGGVLLIEPWFSREQIREGTLGLVTVDEPDLKAVRMHSPMKVTGDQASFDFHYMVATKDGVETYCETHVTGLFSRDTVRRCLESAGLETEFQEDGISGRGLWICTTGDGDPRKGEMLP